MLLARDRLARRDRHVAPVTVEIDITRAAEMCIDLRQVGDIRQALAAPTARLPGCCHRVVHGFVHSHERAPTATPLDVGTVKRYAFPCNRIELNQPADIVDELRKVFPLLEISVVRHERHHALKDMRRMRCSDARQFVQHQTQQIGA